MHCIDGVGLELQLHKGACERAKAYQKRTKSDESRWEQKHESRVEEKNRQRSRVGQAP